MRGRSFISVLRQDSGASNLQSKKGQHDIDDLEEGMWEWSMCEPTRL